MQQQRSRHPALNRILDKVHSGTQLSEDELELLQHLLQDLEESNRRESVVPDITEPLSTDRSEPVITGVATYNGTKNYALQTHNRQNFIDFYRQAQDFYLSSIGIGTYRGAEDSVTDASYIAAITTALRAGINLIDTAINYRSQRSERNVALALRQYFHHYGGQRDEVVVCTKGGFLVPSAITPSSIDVNDVVDECHCMSPLFLADQIDRSRQNLGLETIDVYYLHNPEIQLRFLSKEVFLDRVRAAIIQLESAVTNSYIKYYGIATWDGFRSGSLSLRELAEIAFSIAGDNHHFRFVQLPFNLGMQEARTHLENDKVSTLEVAADLGITVISSSSILQGRLANDLPEQLVEYFPKLHTDAQRAVQFTRSTPGITSALVGMRNPSHVSENLEVAKVPPLDISTYEQCSSI